MGNRINTLFVGNLKLGDNIRFNMESVESLYISLTLSEPKNIKPIAIANISVTEALMIDFVRRIKRHTSEFTYLSDKKRGAIRKLKSDSKCWNFKQSIRKFRHYRLLGNSDNFYDCVDFLRLIRNKVHIQNTFYKRDEHQAWTTDVLRLSELCTEYTLRYLSEDYPRPLQEDYVGGIRIPWHPNYKSGTKPIWKDSALPNRNEACGFA